ncbi:hypothetical protein [Rhizobium sp. RM]|uniref:hypothetical protein n=1 Tax=Rhizobium sp. RM TaxID=2748079 RepID=UPI00110E7FB3|nr:hypothetical protein [Rhizobium sp. RM]NWJ25895.1 hypothetical protein [Rhizobium sp. RM]TMV15823.1 hypothetical protein BJG94_22100 [Rhizobium sp. Td3]
MALKTAKPRFRVAEFGDGTPFIFVDPHGGDDLAFFKNNTDFRLKAGTSYEEAQKISDFLNEHIGLIAEDQTR